MSTASIMRTMAGGAEGDVPQAMRGRRLNICGQNRVCQIGRPSGDENISHLKGHIEDPVKGNGTEETMPVCGSAGEESSMGPKSSEGYNHGRGDTSMLGGHTAAILLGKDVLVLSCLNEALMKTAQMVLERHFADKESLPSLMRTPYGQLDKTSVGSREDLSRYPTSLQGLNDQAMQQWDALFCNPTGSSSDDEVLRDEHNGFSSGRRSTHASFTSFMESHGAAISLPTQLDSSDETQQVTATGSQNGLHVGDRSPQQVSSIPTAQLNAGIPGELPQSSSGIRRYSGDFLLKCALSPLSTVFPPDFPCLDAKVADIIVRQNARASRCCVRA